MVMAEKPWEELIKEKDEMRFDYRLVEKKVDEGFLSHDEVKKFRNSIPEETDYDVTSATELLDELSGENASEESSS